VPLPAEQLDPAYRASLRRLAQARAHVDQLEKRLLREKARHLAAAQRIDDDIEQLRRELRDEQAGHEITALLAHGNHD
jgi:phage-related minor tail protein